MRSLLGWITDVRVHLVVTGILLLHLAVNLGTYSDSSGEDLSLCQKCQFVHGYSAPCSSLALNRGPYRVTR